MHDMGTLGTKNIHFDQRYEIVRRKSMLILHMKKFTAAFTNLTILSLQAYFSLRTHKTLNHELSLTRYTIHTMYYIVYLPQILNLFFISILTFIVNTL